VLEISKNSQVRLTSYGGAETVTGSKHLLQIGDKKILLECGMFQGRRQESNERNSKFPKAILEADAMILSHAHIDHSGAIPSLVKNGYKGPIFATDPTRDLCEIMLADSAHIQEQDAQYLGRRVSPPPEPIYTQVDVNAAMTLFRTCGYYEWFEPVPGVRARFVDAGHILGAAQVEIEYTENGQKKRLGFTGDLGRKHLPIIGDPDQMTKLDYLITESTYANRYHDDVRTISDQLLEVVEKTVKRGGRIIIPAFSVERTQEIIYVLHELKISGKLKHDIPVFVDSPLAVDATEVFKRHQKYFDAETYKTFMFEEKGPFTMKGLEYVREVGRSIELNSMRFPMIIIAASGMCEAGRIRHHLLNNISDPKNTVLIVGFQAEYTLGRKLVDKLPEVKIFGKPVQRRCQVVVINAFSGHADQDELFNNVKKTGAKKVYCVHGEPMAVGNFATRIESEIGVEAVVMKEGSTEEV
jgi:metallo-beta-lactamase family protein